MKRLLWKALDPRALVIEVTVITTAVLMLVF